jgi:heterodisulfide reductase subunit A
VTKVDGHVGDFTSTILDNGKTISVEHGVVILATGAVELKPHSFGYGASDKVVTQLELSGLLYSKKLSHCRNSRPLQ